MTEKILAAAIEVHRVLGPGLLESIYEEALCVEFEIQGVPFERQRKVDVIYKGRMIKGQRIDLIGYGAVIVEVKSQRPNDDLFLAQAISYLRCTGMKRALILNFGLPTLVKGVQRVAL
ncbi:MAG: GxxExxY protein [Planctomycetota bacterium]